MEFSYITKGAISLSKFITKVAIGFEYACSGCIGIHGKAEIKKIYIKHIKKPCFVSRVIENIIFTNNYRFVASGTSSAGGLSRKEINKTKIRTPAIAIAGVFYFRRAA